LEAAVILVRRSHTLKQDFMKTTKTGMRQRITVPSQIIDVLRSDLDTQLVTPEQKASELLFPADDAHRSGVRVDRRRSARGLPSASERTVLRR
jgi:hypothetical protein